MKQLIIFILCLVSISSFAQTQIDSGQIRRIPIAKLVTPTTPTDGQVIKYNAALGKWEPGTDSGGSVSPGGITNSIQANDGASGLKADSTVNLGSTTANSITLNGLKTGKYIGLSNTIMPTGLIFSNKFKPANNRVVPQIVFESPTGDSEQWPFAFVQQGRNNIGDHPASGPNRPADTTWNSVMQWGFNPSSMFGTPTRAKPSGWYSIEPNWYNGGQKWQEFHLSTDWGDGEVRLFTTEIQDLKNTATGPTNVWSFRSDAISWGALKTNQVYFGVSQSDNARTSDLSVLSKGAGVRIRADSLSNYVNITNMYSGTHVNPRDLYFEDFDRILFSRTGANQAYYSSTDGTIYTTKLSNTNGSNGIMVRQGFNFLRGGSWPIGVKFRNDADNADIGSMTISGATGAFQFDLQQSGGWYYNFKIGSNSALSISNANRNISIGGAPLADGTAKLHIGAGTATASTAPLKMTAGTNTTTPEPGAFGEYDGNEFRATTSTGNREILARVLKGSATLDFPNTATNSSSDLTITVTGAADGDVVSLGVPNASITSGLFFAWVSATNMVTVRFHNTSGGGVDPASGTFKVTVTK